LAIAANKSDDYISCKIVLLGETGVGKTSIITRYIANSFSQVVMTSTGSSFFSKKIEINENKRVKLQIWDTAGQEKYRSLAKIFYQSASVAILVYDVTLKRTFENLKEYWVGEIKANAPDDIILAIAANKSDDYINQEVNIQEAKDLAKSLNAIFVCTSAKLGNGIDDLFKMVAEKFIDPEKNIAESYMNKNEILEQQNKIKLEEVRRKQQNYEKNKAKKRKCC
jgi:Ras-related protein Rab-22